MSEGVIHTSLHAEPGEKRMLILLRLRPAALTSNTPTPDEVFVVDGGYPNPGVENDRAFAAGS